ncbi:MAG: hypothetical protein GC202_01530 [Alphaproteobacteria bacterium]|nr:hypothetical protein [Alphaproteobacteria bacterium]
MFAVHLDDQAPCALRIAVDEADCDTRCRELCAFEFLTFQKSPGTRRKGIAQREIAGHAKALLVHKRKI